MKTYFIILTLTLTLSLNAQVGINTTTPHPSSVLDIDSSDKGMLIPRVSLDNVVTTQIDGINTAAQGLLIYNTNVATLGGNGIGFYVFNGTTWEKVTTTADGIGGSDADFFEEGTTNPPNDINDDIYTLGNVAIGKNTANYPLDIDATSLRGINNVIRGTDNTIRYGVYNEISNTGTGDHYGFYNQMAGTSNATKYGLYNSITNSGSAPQFGVRNQIINAGTGNRYGTFNNIAAFNANAVYATYNFIDGGTTGDRFGNYNQISNTGTGRLYGSFTTLGGAGTGIKFGDYITVANSVPGTHYGVYSDVLKPGSFAGYFRGNLAIGTTDFTSGTPNYYIFPSSRGTNGQVMQTDGSGNLSWVDASGLGDSDADFFEEGTTNPPDDINDDIYTLGNLAIGKNTADYPLEIQTSTLNRGLNINVTGTDNATKYGNYTAISNTGAGLHYGNVIELNSGSGQKFGNRIFITGTGGSIGTENYLNTTGFSGTTGTLNAITGDAGQLFGTFNFINGSGNGQHYGVRNQISTTGDADLYGTLNQINFSSGSGAKYGSINTINQASGGTHYGVFSEVLKTNSFAGYFLGNVSIGTTTTNNYILPPSRGTSGQIMQTDGSGNLSWVNLPTQTNDWSLTGNSGTNPAVNFIGTTDNVALSFRTNNIQRLQIDNNILRTYGDFQINDPSDTTQSSLLQNDDNFVHAVDANLDFGLGGNHVILSSQEGGAETGGIHLDGDNAVIWSPADGLRALRILDEDNWNDNDGNPYDNNAEIAYVDNNGQYVQASDQNRKQNIQKINNALNSISQLNGYTYEYKINAEEKAKGEKPIRTSGVLAQEIQKVLPEAVQVSEYGEYFVHYAGITPLLIEAIKELKTENETLKQNYHNSIKRIEKLEASNTKK